MLRWDTRAPFYEVKVKTIIILRDNFYKYLSGLLCWLELDTNVKNSKLTEKVVFTLQVYTLQM